jgi:hypothetical protein
LRFLKALDRFVKTEAGNVKQLEGFDPPLFRLRVGAWRFIYRKAGDNAIESSASATAKKPTGKKTGRSAPDHLAVAWQSTSSHNGSQRAV